MESERSLDSTTLFNKCRSRGIRVSDNDTKAVMARRLAYDIFDKDRSTTKVLGRTGDTVKLVELTAEGGMKFTTHRRTEYGFVSVEDDVKPEKVKLLMQSLQGQYVIIDLLG